MSAPPRRLRDRGTGMSMTVKTVMRWLKGPILLFGIYMVVYGHITPGGGFGGGVVIASAFILITLAAGQQEGQRTFPLAVASRLDSAGLLLFLAIGWLATWWASGYFFENYIGTDETARFSLLSGGVIPLGNLALGLKVASALFLVFTVLTTFHITDEMLGEEETQHQQEDKT